MFEAVRIIHPRASFGTVYRNLGILVEKGDVDRLEFSRGTDRYDARTGGHYHFVCESCGRVEDLDIPRDPSLEKRAAEASGLTVLRHQVEFFGLCEDCR